MTDSLQIDESGEAAPSGKRPEAVRPDLCKGCLVCALRCSLRRDKTFSLAGSAVRIQVVHGSPGFFEHIVLDSCDGCGLCARHCPYGVLEMKEAGG